MIAGHGGMLDRVDSICFAAPVFFHLVRYLYVDVRAAQRRLSLHAKDQYPSRSALGTR